MFSEKDLKQFSDKGIAASEIDRQLQLFVEGLPFLPITGAATVGNGIVKVDDTRSAVSEWDSFVANDLSILKFVPASGAATRMFKDLYEFQNGQDSYPSESEVKKFFDKVEKFAFIEDLSIHLETVDLGDNNYHKKVISRFLDKSGMGYGLLPKGLLKFHAYKDGARTPAEEHWVEGCTYACSSDKKVNLHFTISPQFIEPFKKLESKKKVEFEKKYGVSINISYSVQDPSTDTVAADSDNNPFRLADGSIMFRPGGHGALLKNLDELDADVIFIKNIDNVVPDHLKPATVEFKKVIGAILMRAKEQIFAYHKQLVEGTTSSDDLNKMIAFAESDLLVRLPEAVKAGDDVSKKETLLSIFDRPLRVCGMVKNEGEPGGGPFWVKNAKGIESLQIAESSQLDLKDEKVASMVASASHFNPVDLVCSVRNYKGKKYDLMQYLDDSTAFISLKSKEGKVLQALERPGLWNGAMANWNTIFVEVPIETFNPVKTVNDLLRPQHQ